jgi:hypothetical protein
MGRSMRIGLSTIAWIKSSSLKSLYICVGEYAKKIDQAKDLNSRNDTNLVFSRILLYKSLIKHINYN